MKRESRACILLIFILLTFSLSTAWSQDLKPIQLGSWALGGTARSRVENWNWFTPDKGDPNYTFMGNHLRLNLTRAGKQFDTTVEIESPILLGLPNNAVAPGAQGQLGMGASYFVSNHNKQNVGMVFPKQVFIRFREVLGSNSALRIGRFEFQDGGEVVAKDPTIGVIKRDRVNQRLIGPFVFTHVMRSFDGFHYTTNRGNINYTLVGAFPTRGVFEVDAWGWMKTAFTYASATGQVQPGKTNTGEWRVFGIYYDDWRHILKQDNRPTPLRTRDLSNIRIGTYGGHYVQVAQTSAGKADVMVIAAGQFGTWGTLRHRAGMVDVEAGFQPNVLPKVKPWVRAGYYYGTGDNDPADNKHGTFFQILPTARPFARFPFFDMMNNEDRFAMLTIRPHPRVALKTEAHALRLANANDLWYIGGGAFQPWTFGYQSKPSGGSRSLGNLYDVSGDVTVNAHLTYTVYFGYAQGKSVIRNIYPRGADGQLAFAEMTYRF